MFSIIYIYWYGSGPGPPALPHAYMESQGRESGPPYPSMSLHRKPQGGRAEAYSATQNDTEYARYHVKEELGRLAWEAARVGGLKMMWAGVTRSPLLDD